MTRLVLSTFVLIFTSIATSLPSGNITTIDYASIKDLSNPSDVDELTSAITLLSIEDVSPVDSLLVGGDMKSLEWTALGDSYAAGVGSGDYVDGRRCLRFSEAYPVIMNNNPDWTKPGGPSALLEGTHKLNNVVCSGAEIQDIIDYQLLDEPASTAPNFQYGKLTLVSCCISDLLRTWPNNRIRSAPCLWITTVCNHHGWWR